MKKGPILLFLAVLLFLLAIYLGTTDVYTSVKGFVVDISGSIELAISIAMGLILIAFTSGTLIIRKLSKT